VPIVCRVAMTLFLLSAGTLLSVQPLLSAPESDLAAALPQLRPMGQTSAVGLPMQIVLMLTGLTVLPAAVMCLTPFLRISLVLHFLRQALGTQTAPSNPVLLGLALLLSLLAMQPIGKEIYEKAWLPMEKGTMTMAQALEASTPTLRTHLLRYAREKDLQMLIEAAKIPAPAKASDLELRILCPAYILSELRAGFQIGAMLYLPFLVIDLLIASVTLSIGIVQLPPAMVSAPFKILLFVVADGWNLVIGSLLKSLG
jgi:flagellar biosynthesis protein FliP